MGSCACDKLSQDSLNGGKIKEEDACIKKVEKKRDEKVSPVQKEQSADIEVNHKLKIKSEQPSKDNSVDMTAADCSNAMKISQKESDSQDSLKFYKNQWSISNDYDIKVHVVKHCTDNSIKIEYQIMKQKLKDNQQLKTLIQKSI